MANPDNGIRGILFDLDGVLVDGPKWHEEAFNQTLEYFLMEPLAHEDHMTNFNGLSTHKKLDILKERGTFKESEHGLEREWFYDEKQFRTENIIKEKCKPVTRIIDTVVYANSVFQNNTAVVTNCSRATAELMLTKANLIDRFKVIVTNEDVDGYTKPHPWPYIKAQNMLGFENRPKCMLAIDDTEKGIASAVDAMCSTWRLKSFEELTVRNLMRVLSNYTIRI